MSDIQVAARLYFFSSHKYGGGKETTGKKKPDLLSLFLYSDMQGVDHFLGDLEQKPFHATLEGGT